MNDLNSGTNFEPIKSDPETFLLVSTGVPISKRRKFLIMMEQPIWLSGERDDMCTKTLLSKRDR